MRLTRQQMNQAALGLAQKLRPEFTWEVKPELTRQLDQHGNVSVLSSKGSPYSDQLIFLALFQGEEVYYAYDFVSVFSISCAFRELDMIHACARHALHIVRRQARKK